MSYKSLTLFSILLLSVLFLGAQQIDYYLKGGLNISTGKVMTPRTYKGTGIGFHAGIVGDVQIAENIVLQPGALLSLKNAKVSDLNGIKISLLALDIPVIALYKKNNFFGGIGPALNIGLFGNYSFQREKYSLFDQNNEGRFAIKRIEVALNVLAGYQLPSGLFFSVNYAPGLNNLFSHSAYANSDTKVKTSVIGLSAGYPLSSITKK